MAIITQNNDRELWKTSVTIAIENSLRDIGKYEYRHVLDTLKSNYDSSFSDCYDNPNILKKTLKDIFGNSYEAIISSIEENLNGVALVEPVKEFLAYMRKL